MRDPVYIFMSLDKYESTIRRLEKRTNGLEAMVCFFGVGLAILGVTLFSVVAEKNEEESSE